MAITHKRQDDLETLFSNFATVPKENTIEEPEPDDKATVKKES